MRIAPRGKRRLAAQILDADIVAADERALAIDHDDLAVIAEIELEAVDEALVGRERMHLDAARAHRGDIAMRQIEAADAVVQHIRAHTLRDFRDQRVLDQLTERVGAHDEKLHDHIAACVFNRFEDRGEGGFAVHQRAHRVARQERHARQARQRTHEVRAERLRGPFMRRLRVPFGRLRARAQQFVAEAARIDIAGEFAAAEKQIRNERQIRHRDERYRPCDRTLRGTGMQDRMACGDGAQQVAEKHQRADVKQIELHKRAKDCSKRCRRVQMRKRPGESTS
ncbi:hypothetical protein LMG29739_06098 [Paraburkholderia solisilvae]|uniref:Uncharacterized protein n=1 Tax=Paraburkholderia solisilvae TaxID=624376 RepID=A0A6J5F327_9BURK|nr:hypothetical protein LMG29739_06098 [Paraburkholderia solisilvae]